MSRVFKVDYIPDPDRGRPLWNAKIFVGVANQDPTIPSNQIQLTGDIGFPVGQSIPVPQPVRTNAGGITVYNNSPLDLNAPGQEYAIQIFDRNDNLIYNFPQVDGSVVMNTTSQEEVTGLTIWPEVGEAVIGQTIPSGTDAIRYPFNGRSTLFTIKPPVAVTGTITNITINSSGIGELEVDNSDVYDLAEFNSFIAANDGDSQLAGGNIWPLSSQDSAQVGDVGLSGISVLRDTLSQSLYLIYSDDKPVEVNGDITALDFTSQTATIGGVDCILKIVDDSLPKSSSDWAQTIEDNNVLRHRTLFPQDTKLQTNRPVKLDAFGKRIDGQNPSLLTAGDNLLVKNGIQKTTNTAATVQLESGTEDVDCIAYVPYEIRQIDGDDYFQSALILKDIGLSSNTVSPNESGLFVALAGGLEIDNVGIIGATNSFEFRDCFSSIIKRCFFQGQFRYFRGTSMTLENLTATPSTDPGVSYAYNIQGMLYSTLISCTADNLTYPAFRFQDCHGVTLIGCGSESNNVSSTINGSAIDSEGFNEITIIGFQYANKTTDIAPTFAFDQGDNIQIIGGRSNLETPRTNKDIYIKRGTPGNRCYVEIFGHTFQDQTTPGGGSIPDVEFAAGVTDALVRVHSANGDIVDITPTGTTTWSGGSNAVSWTPVLNAGATAETNYTTQAATWSRAGDMVTCNIEILMSSVSANAGQMNIGTLPFLSSTTNPSVSASVWVNQCEQGVTAELPIDSRNIFLYKTDPGDSKIAAPLTTSDLNAIAHFKVSITYKAEDI